ncbi:MAG TPA: hypothetical protein DD473_13485 [Planctomycetaceae bacterium]|nr:hypothetical protein [Planctomycetaceae bacterium]
MTGLKGCVLGFLGGVPTFVMVGLNGCGFGAGLGYSFRRSWLVMGVVLMRGIPTHLGLSGASNPSLHWTYSENVLNLMGIFRPIGDKKKKPGVVEAEAGAVGTRPHRNCRRFGQSKICNTDQAGQPHLDIPAPCLQIGPTRLTLTGYQLHTSSAI